MEQQNHTQGILDQFLTPAFSVKDGIISQINYEAQRRMLQPGTSISSLLDTDLHAYNDFTGGCLYLTLHILDQDFGAAVTRQDGFDLFVMDHEIEQQQLRSFALASRELRAPLAEIICAADSLLSKLDDGSHTDDEAATISRSIHRLHRLVCNMSDAARYTSEPDANQSIRNLCAIFDEAFERSAALAEHAGITLHYTSASTDVYGLADEEMLQRAVYNLISNALKFTPKGGRIDAKLTLRGSRLYLTVQDSGTGVPEKLRSSVFRRYQRSATVEDGHFGIGLGMVIVRAAAVAHGGTVLLEQPEGQGARFTMTLAVRQVSSGALRTHTVTSDYAGERDRGLLELSDVLPLSAYKE